MSQLIQYNMWQNVRLQIIEFFAHGNLQPGLDNASSLTSKERVHCKLIFNTFFRNRNFYVKFIAKNQGKGPFLYYVRVFWGFFEPPIHLHKDIFTT